MDWWEILLIIAITSFTVFMITFAIIRKAKGKPIGGSGCCSSASCKSCNHKCSMDGKTLLDEYHKCNCGNCSK